MSFLPRTTAFILLTCSIGMPAQAQIVIEERPLSRPFVPAPVAAEPVVVSMQQSAAATEEATAAAAEASGTDSPDNAGNTESNGTVELFTRLQQLEQEASQLRGLIEQQGHLIERLQSDLRTRYTDLDQRLQLQQEQFKAAATGVAESPAQTVSATASATIEEEKRAYLAAYEMFRTGGPDKAIPPMLAFVNRYPASTFTPGAHYWLGEFYLNAATPNMAGARKQFEAVLVKFPEHDKAPAALYKLASIHDLEGRTLEAQQQMQELMKSYPQSPEAALADTWLKTMAASKAAAAKPATSAASTPAAVPAKKPAATPAKPAAKQQ
ncbi:MAG: tol-pal system protein YbgF [Moraxellaceae bacterium]|nr:tol-pal system protein YbgF [Moraxellaceae bacterium]